jgi:hypothetical protein
MELLSFIMQQKGTSSFFQGDAEEMRKTCTRLSAAGLSKPFAEPWLISPEQAAANLRTLRGSEPQKHISV